MNSMIAGNVKKIMNRQGVKQKAVAQKAGYTEKVFSHMLNGRKLITDNDILPICFALQVTPNELFGLESSGT